MEEKDGNEHEITKPKILWYVGSWQLMYTVHKSSCADSNKRIKWKL